VKSKFIFINIHFWSQEKSRSLCGGFFILRCRAVSMPHEELRHLASPAFCLVHLLVPRWTQVACVLRKNLERPETKRPACSLGEMRVFGVSWYCLKLYSGGERGIRTPGR